MPILNTDSLNTKRFDDFIHHSPYARVSQDRNWLHVKKGWSGEYVYLEEDGEIKAAMSILAIRSIGDKSLLYANRGPVCDFSDVNTVKQLISEARPLFEKHNAFLLRLDPEYPWDEGLLKKYRNEGFNFRSREIDSHSFIQPRFNMILNLKNKSKAELFDSFSSKTRYNIRYAKKKGVQTRFVNVQRDGEQEVLSALDSFYELTEIMAERNGITHRPKDYFVRLFEAFPDSRVYLTSYEQENLSAALAIPYNKKLFYMYGASSNKNRKLMPNYQMQWHMIQWALELGMDEYDFGGVFELNNDDGLFRFKNGFCKMQGPIEFIGELDLVLDKEAYNKFIG